MLKHNTDNVAQLRLPVFVDQNRVVLLSQLRITLFQLPAPVSLASPPSYCLYLPHVYIEAIEPHLIERVLIVDFPIDSITRPIQVAYQDEREDGGNAQKEIQDFTLK